MCNEKNYKTVSPWTCIASIEIIIEAEIIPQQMYIHYIHLLQFETYMSFKYKKKTVFHLLIILMKLVLSSYSQVFYEESTKAINASVHHAVFV